MTKDDILNPDVEGLYEIIKLPEKPEAWCVKLLHDEWYGVVLTYGEVSLVQEEDRLRSKIEYDILYVPDVLRKKEMEDEKGVEFETLIGKIAMNILYANAGDLSPSDNDDKKLIIKK